MKKQALLIGINQYQNLTELKYARQDAEAVAESLKQNYCFSDDEIILLTDAKRGLFYPSTKGVIQKHLEDLIQQNYEFDLFVFGFWGHGLYRSGQRYLCPQAVMDEDVCELGLSFDALQKLIVNVQAKNTCMIFDCCQTIDGRGNSETLSEADQTIMENAARNIAFNKNKLNSDFLSNVAILNSCSKGQRAYEWDERKHGIFTAHLLDAMNRRIDSISPLISYVGKHVKQTALELGKDQKPYYTLSGDSDFPLPVSDNASSPAHGDVFISYRSHHIKLVEPILKELRKREISYFIDSEKLKLGNYARKLTDALRACKVLMLLWTQDINDSEYVPDEISLAHDWGKEIIPYKIGNFDINDQSNVILYLKTKHIVEDSHNTIIDLVDSIEQALVGRAPAPTVDNTPPKPEPPTLKPSGNGNKISAFIANKINQLESAALEAIDKEDYKTAIPKLEDILALDSNITGAQRLLALCKTKIEANKRREEETERRRLEVEQRAETERKRREAEEAERKYRQAEETVRRRLEAVQKVEAEQRAETERKRREAEETERKYREAEETVRRRIEAARRLLEEETERRCREAEESEHRHKEAVQRVEAERKRLEAKLRAEELRIAEAKLKAEELRIAEAERKHLEEAELRAAFLQTLKIERKRLEEANKHDLPVPGIKAGKRKIETVNGVEFAFRWCPPGTFLMGSPETEEGRLTSEKQHQVTLTKGFWILETQVTQKQWKAIMGNNPSKFKGDDLPVENVSWDDCQGFCKKCAQLGLLVQLPTEAQWEYACRAGTTGAYAGNLDEMAWFDEDWHKGCTHPVGTKKPNAWGLYDMHGNVWEWCQDGDGDYPSESVTDPTGPSSDSFRVYRGGSWNRGAEDCRSSNRDGNDQEYRSRRLGFRVLKGQ